MDHKREVASFKSTAWINRKAARNYRKNLNKSSPVYNAIISEYCRRVGLYLSPPAKVLDLGAGTGALSIPLAIKGYDITAVDISAAMLTELSGIARKQRIMSPPDTLVSDLRDTPKNLIGFDAIVSHWVLPHFPDWRDIVRRWFACLAPGGYFIFDMPSKEHVDNHLPHGYPVKKFGYDHYSDPNSDTATWWYATSSLADLQALANSLGAELVSAAPIGYLKSNAALFNVFGSDNWSALANHVDHFLLDHPSAANSVSDFEEALFESGTANRAEVHGSLAIIRKARH